MERDALGLYGEQAAARHLVSSGYAIICRRWRTRTGEIDLVARRGDEIVFVEVKTRSGSCYGAPEESVTAAKRRRLRSAAYAFLDAKGWRRKPFRIDVIAVLAPSGAGEPVIRHLPHAVGEDD